MTPDIIRAYQRLVMYRGEYLLAMSTYQHTANTHPNHYHKEYAEKKINEARKEYQERLEFYIELRLSGHVNDLTRL